MDTEDSDEPFLIRDYFKVARENFLITSPVESSYPSTTQIVLTWQLIAQQADVAEEKVLYYSLEWDQGPIQEWRELTTPSQIVTTYTLSQGFMPGVTYGFRLRALDSIGYGPYS